MKDIAETKNGSMIAAESKKLKRAITLLPLIGLIYFTVSGGTFGIEPLVGYSGPGLALVLICLTPLIFSLPNVYIVRELQSMMPVEGGYYHWVKRAFGPFAGFMAGWNNWVVAWLDVSIYPVLGALYLSLFIPQLDQGALIMGVEVSAGFLQWLVAVVMIWFVAWLQVRGSKITGWFTNTLGVVMMIPLILMTILGFVAWAKSGTTPALPFLPGGETINLGSLTAAFSTGLFVVMWNYMGWELPAAAGDEVVNPKKNYPRAMAITLVLAVLTYTLPTVAALYGGAGEDGRYMMWGIEESVEGAGIGADLEAYGVSGEQITAWGSDPADATGWEFPQIAKAIVEKLTGRSDSGLGILLGALVTISAILSMLGLFIGNSLGGSRVPFALAEDGMMPRWMVKVHPSYGTPWVAILFVSLIYTVFATNAFAFLVVADVFLQLTVTLAEVAAVWALRRKEPNRPRNLVPGGLLGLILCTLGLVLIISVAIISQVVSEGFSSIGWGLGLMALGVALYIPFRKYLKRGVPDVDPTLSPVEEG